MDQDQPSANSAPQPPASARGSSGPFFGIIIVIALLMLGGWYFWQQSNVESTADLPLIPGDEVSGEAWVPPTSNSDDAAAIETELEAMDMSSFEAMMNADVEATDAAL